MKRKTELASNHAWAIIEKFPFLFFLILSTFFLFFNSTFSPLIDYPPSPSANMFRTIGLGIFDGLVPYRDLWDGKGFMCFFLVGSFAKIFPGIYFGQWVLSCLTVATTCYYMYKTAKDVIKSEHAIIAVILCMVPLFLREILMGWGGSSDEYIMPFSAAILFYSSYTIKYKEISKRGLFIMGISMSIIFWIKFTVCVGFGILFIGVLVSLYKQTKKKALYAALIWLACFATISGAIIAYYLYHNALFNLYYGYYLFHKLYHPQGINLIHNLLYELLFQPFPLIFCALSVLSFLFIYSKEHLFQILILSSSLIVLILIIFWGAAFMYYLLPIIPYTIFTSCLILNSKSSISKLVTVGLVCVLLISYSNLYRYPNLFAKADLKTALERKEEVIAIAEYIKKHEDKTLMYYKCMELGIHHYIGEYPHTLYYQSCNYDPIGWAEQVKTIQEQKTHFIATGLLKSDSEAYTLIVENGYELVEHQFTSNPRLRLFKRAQK